MRCIPGDQGRELLQEIHVGTCGHHAGTRTLVGMACWQGFCWPTAVADSKDIARFCEGCQFYARQTHLPAQALQTIPITWPFAVWHLDMVGPLRRASGASLTFSWRSTSSPSRSRLDPSSTSAPKRRYLSSPTSFTASAYPTRSSPTTTLSSQGRQSSTSATTTTSVWTVGCCSPEDEHASREGEWHDPTRPEATNLQATREVLSKMGD
jgi:hypothetical protein